MSRLLRTLDSPCLSRTEAEATSDADEQLQMAARAGAARELYEETGMDFLRQLDRFQPAALKKAAGSKGLPNELKSRLFYFLTVSDRDFPSNGVAPVGTSGRYLHLRHSVEHSDYIFQPEPTEAAEMLKYHSGGKCGQAFLMAMGPSSDQKGREHVNKSAPVDVVEIAESKPVDLLPPPQKEKACCFFGK
jgi:hypothetical protein